MNQFNKYSEQLKKIGKAREISYVFDYILNNIWCTYSFYEGKMQWKDIEAEIPEPFRSHIALEISHVELGYGIQQARLAVKDEMEKYIDYLIKEMSN